MVDMPRVGKGVSKSKSRDIPGDVKRIIACYAVTYAHGEATYIRDRKFKLDGREYEFCVYARDLVAVADAAVASRDTDYIRYKGAWVSGVFYANESKYTFATRAVEFLIDMQDRMDEVDFAVWANELCDRPKTVCGIGAPDGYTAQFAEVVKAVTVDKIVLANRNTIENIPGKGPIRGVSEPRFVQTPEELAAIDRFLEVEDE